MEEKLIEKTESLINEIIKGNITQSNIDNLYKLAKINHMAKEDERMNYGNYGGRGPGHGSYGRYGDSYGEYYGESSYGRRGVDSRYRGFEHLDRMADNYGRYRDGRDRYGNNEESKKSLKYMLESMEDFAKMLKGEAESQEELQMIRDSVQRDGGKRLRIRRRI